MLRAELLDENPPEWMKELGGSHFKNMWTPGPDTPRGLSSFFFGKYPGESGHVFRSQYPAFPCKESNRTILDSLSSNGFEIFVLQSEIDAKFGRFVPPTPPRGWNYFTRRSELLDSLRLASPSRKIAVLYQNNDYHYEIDRARNSATGHQFGLERISSDIRQLFDTLGQSFFDVGYFFSDHGCVFTEEDVDESNWLDERRARAFFFKSNFRGNALETVSELADLPTAHHLVMREVTGEFAEIGLPGWTIIEDYPKGHSPHENQRLTEWIVLGPDGQRLRCSASHSEVANCQLLSLPLSVVQFIKRSTWGMSAFLDVLEEERSNSAINVPPATFLDGSEVFPRVSKLSRATHESPLTRLRRTLKKRSSRW